MHWHSAVSLEQARTDNSMLVRLQGSTATKMPCARTCAGLVMILATAGGRGDAARPVPLDAPISPSDTSGTLDTSARDGLVPRLQVRPAWVGNTYGGAACDTQTNCWAQTSVSGAVINAATNRLYTNAGWDGECMQCRTVLYSLYKQQSSFYMTQ